MINFTTDNIDREISIVSYQIELKMFLTLYKQIPMEEIIKNFKSNANKYMEENFKYRNIVSNIICLISAWEQQLYNFCSKHCNVNIKNEFKALKPFYINTIGMLQNEFDQIDEYRDLENVFKHGKGTSYNNLILKNSKFLEPTTSFKELQNGVSFNMLILNIDENTIQEICDALCNFWDVVKNKVIVR